MIYIVIILFVIVAILIATNIRIISQSDAVVIERLGAYLKTWTVGFISFCLSSIFYFFINLINTKDSL